MIWQWHKLGCNYMVWCACGTYDTGVWQCLVGFGKVCDGGEEEVKQVHLQPLQGERCRGFAPAGEDYLQTLPSQVYHKY